MVTAVLSPAVRKSGGCVFVEFPKSAWGVEIYIEARSDVRYPGAQFIEVVVDGLLQEKYTEYMDSAPIRIIKLIKKWGNK